MAATQDTASKKKKRVTFAMDELDTTDTETDTEETPKNHETTTQDLQMATSTETGQADATGKPSASDIALRKAGIAGLLTAGGTSQQMIDWMKEYRILCQELDEVRRTSSSKITLT